MDLHFVICADTVGRTFNLILVIILIMLIKLVIVGPVELRILSQAAMFRIIEVFLTYLWHFSVLLVANQRFETSVRS